MIITRILGSRNIICTYTSSTLQMSLTCQELFFGVMCNAQSQKRHFLRKKIHSKCKIKLHQNQIEI